MFKNEMEKMVWAAAFAGELRNGGSPVQAVIRAGAAVTVLRELPLAILKTGHKGTDAHTFLLEAVKTGAE